MKQYYKNWYQHYLELEAEKEREIKRSYYSNIAVKKGNHEHQQILQTLSNFATEKPSSKVRKKQTSSPRLRLFNLFLPLLTVVAFVAVWYRLDLGPVRYYVNEALVFVGVRTEVLDVSGGINIE